MATRIHWTSLLYLLALTSTLSALPGQVPADTAVIASRLPAPNQTLLLTVDLATNNLGVLSGFANDIYTPLAVSIDPISRDVLVAVDLGAASRIVRLQVQGTAIVGERVLADVSGTISDILIPYPGNLVVTVDGAQGGAVAVARNGSAPVVVLNAANVVGGGLFGASSTEIWLAESGSGAVSPQLRTWNSLTGATYGTSPLSAIPPSTLTGIGQLLSSIPTHVLTTTSGQVWQNVLQQTLVALPITPALPPGGAQAVRVHGGNQGYVLGGAAFPFLQRFDAYDTLPQTWVPLAGPLPGDPVAFAISAQPYPQVYAFGERCSPAAVMPSWSLSGGQPRLGNAMFEAVTFGSPGVVALLGLGFTDQAAAGVPLPVALPGGGCDWLVAPEFSVFYLTDATGRASHPLPIPNTPSLAGVVLFGQWAHLVGGPLIAVTDAMALHIYP